MTNTSNYLTTTHFKTVNYKSVSKLQQSYFAQQSAGPLKIFLSFSDFGKQKPSKSIKSMSYFWKMPTLHFWVSIK